MDRSGGGRRSGAEFIAGGNGGYDGADALGKKAVKLFVSAT